MKHIFWELSEIPRPPESHINHHDGRVYILYDDGNGPSPVTIGRAVSEEMMHPNVAFRSLFPALWKKYYPREPILPHALHVGFYAMSLGIGYQTGLYPALQNTFGPLHANALMDYANFSIVDRSDASHLYEAAMEEEVLFSRKLYSDTWLSDLFEKKLDPDDIHAFKMRWITECMSRGVKSIWLSIDGSNNDSFVRKSSLPEKGKAKSGKNRNLISYIYAVDAETGLPITYFVNDGSVSDSKALQQVAELLKGAGYKVKGVLLDRGFCTHDVIQKLMDIGYPYVIMMKSDTKGFISMMEKHGNEIKWNVRYCTNDKGQFGTQEVMCVFGSHPEEAMINLYYDGSNGTERSITPIGKVVSAGRMMQEQIDAGRKPAVPKDLQRFLSVHKEGDTWQIEYNYDVWQSEVDGKGYSAIAVSPELELGAAEADRIYNLRNASEVQFSIMKTQLGYRVTRVHYSKGIENKFLACFIASIIRSEVLNACRDLGYNTNQMIKEIGRIELMLVTERMYAAVDNLTERQMIFLKKFDIRSSDFKAFAEDVNRRMNSPINSQVHKIPDRTKQTRKRGRPPKEKTDEASAAEQKTTKKRGRPPGRKNNSTLEKEALAAKQEAMDRKPESAVPKKRGRPPGRKSDKTLEKEALAAALAALGIKPETAVPRKRGRPPGRKGDKTLENEAPTYAQAVMDEKPEPKEPKKRGRPLGRKGDKTLEKEALAAAREALGLKPEPEELKKRGRPPGRKSGKAQEKEPQTAMNTKSESSVLKKSDSVLEKIALAAAQAAMSAMKEPSAPRKRGRPRKIAEQS